MLERTHLRDSHVQMWSRLNIGNGNNHSGSHGSIKPSASYSQREEEGERSDGRTLRALAVKMLTIENCRPLDPVQSLTQVRIPAGAETVAYAAS